jgi:hypothetical protein
VIVASTCTFFVGLQWGFSETLMPQFLTREYGEGEDGARYVYRIHSINLWGCVLGPPLVAAMSGHLEAFGVLMPGLWVMAAAPIFVIMFPNIFVSVITINPLLLPVVVLFLEFFVSDPRCWLSRARRGLSCGRLSSPLASACGRLVSSHGSLPSRQQVRFDHSFCACVPSLSWQIVDFAKEGCDEKCSQREFVSLQGVRVSSLRSRRVRT